MNHLSLIKNSLFISGLLLLAILSKAYCLTISLTAMIVELPYYKSLFLQSGEYLTTMGDYVSIQEFEN